MTSANGKLVIVSGYGNSADRDHVRRDLEPTLKQFGIRVEFNGGSMDKPSVTSATIPPEDARHIAEAIRRALGAVPITFTWQL